MAWLQYLGDSDYINHGTGENSDVYFKLSDTLWEKNEGVLDMEGWTLPPIGTKNNPFVGYFDGNGCTIENLTVTNDYSKLDRHPTTVNEKFNTGEIDCIGNNPTTGKNKRKTGKVQIVGLFGVVGPFGKANHHGSEQEAVKDLKIHNLEVVSADTGEDTGTLVGAVAGYVNGTIKNVAVNTISVETASDATVLTDLQDEMGHQVTDKHLSWYTTVGYANKKYVREMYTNQTQIYDPKIEYKSFNAVSQGAASGWGGSVNFKEQYQQLHTRENQWKNSYASDTYYAEANETKDISADGNGKTTVENIESSQTTWTDDTDSSVHPDANYKLVTGDVKGKDSENQDVTVASYNFQGWESVMSDEHGSFGVPGQKDLAYDVQFRRRTIKDTLEAFAITGTDFLGQTFALNLIDNGGEKDLDAPLFDGDTSATPWFYQNNRIFCVADFHRYFLKVSNKTYEGLDLYFLDLDVDRTDYTWTYDSAKKTFRNSAGYYLTFRDGNGWFGLNDSYILDNGMGSNYQRYLSYDAAKDRLVGVKNPNSASTQFEFWDDYRKQDEELNDELTLSYQTDTNPATFGCTDDHKEVRQSVGGSYSASIKLYDGKRISDGKSQAKLRCNSGGYDGNNYDYLNLAPNSQNTVTDDENQATTFNITRHSNPYRYGFDKLDQGKKTIEYMDTFDWQGFYINVDNKYFSADDSGLSCEGEKKHATVFYEADGALFYFDNDKKVHYLSADSDNETANRIVAREKDTRVLFQWDGDSDWDTSGIKRGYFSAISENQEKKKLKLVTKQVKYYPFPGIPLSWYVDTPALSTDTTDASGNDFNGYIEKAELNAEYHGGALVRHQSRPTYFALQRANGSDDIADNNTGYFVGETQYSSDVFGSGFGTTGGMTFNGAFKNNFLYKANTGYNSGYPSSTSDRCYSDDKNFFCYTIGKDGNAKKIGDPINGKEKADGYTSYQDLGFKKYYSAVSGSATGTRVSVGKNLNSTDPYLYDLEFDTGSMDMDHITTLPYAKVNDGKKLKVDANGNKSASTTSYSEYRNYELPQKSIDFNLKEAGYINFVSATSLIGNTKGGQGTQDFYKDDGDGGDAQLSWENGTNNCFLTLYRIVRNPSDPCRITGIKQISKIYKNTAKTSDAPRYVYEYTDGTFDTGVYNQQNNQVIPGVKGTDVLFDMTELSDPEKKNWHNYSAYYFEIPVNEGEFALGSPGGTTDQNRGWSDNYRKVAAPILYLDIGANAETIHRSTVYERIDRTRKDYTLPMGISTAYFALPPKNKDGNYKGELEKTALNINDEKTVCVRMDEAADKTRPVKIEVAENNTDVTLTNVENKSDGSLNYPSYKGEGLNLVGNKEVTADKVTTDKLERMTYYDTYSSDNTKVTKTVISNLNGKKEAHKYLLKDGSYVEVQDGKENDYFVYSSDDETLGILVSDLTSLGTKVTGHIKDDGKLILTFSYMTENSNTITETYVLNLTIPSASFTPSENVDGQAETGRYVKVTKGDGYTITVTHDKDKGTEVSIHIDSTDTTYTFKINDKTATEGTDIPSSPSAPATNP